MAVFSGILMAETITHPATSNIQPFVTEFAPIVALISFFSLPPLGIFHRGCPNIYNKHLKSYILPTRVTSPCRCCKITIFVQYLFAYGDELITSIYFGKQDGLYFRTDFVS